MIEKPIASIIHHFSSIEDPRVDRQKKHQLQDIFFIALCAVICGADNWVAIEEFGKAKIDWFTKLLGLQHGIPAHDTFGDVFAAIDNEQFGECFSNWVSDLASLTEGEVIAIDGKCLRRSIDKASRKAAIHMVSAWAQHNSLVLGQVKVDNKSNEITAIPKLLSRLNIAGSVVTVDAMGCQKRIAQQIIQQGGDYVLSLKGNQGNLHEDVATYFTSQLSPEAAMVTVDGSHGRIETLTVCVTDDIAWLKERHAWAGLQSIIAVTATRESINKITGEKRYFISSLPLGIEQFSKAVRRHWGIETTCHWSLDVTYGEDGLRTRERTIAENLAWLRRFTLSLLKQHPGKDSLAMKRRICGWDDGFLMQVLGVKAV